MVPHLVTALKGPLLDLERGFLDATPRIERWFRLAWQEHTPPFYCSTDLRNAGFKLAPVDTNLFPASFNNLSADVMPLAVQAAMAAIDKYCPDARNLLLIVEKDARSASYLDHLKRLAAIMRQTGLNVRFGSLDPALREPQQVVFSDGQQLLVEPLVRGARRIGLADFDPCSILLNDDLSSAIPDALRGLHEQVVLPPVHAGWAVRRKTNHFTAYREVARKFAKAFDIDPWLIDPLFASCGAVDLGKRAGEDCLATNVDAILRKTRSKYREYGVRAAPFVIVKADAGTHGVAIMTVKDAKQMRGMDSEYRARMSVGADGRAVTEMIVQEGVPTFETINESWAEPVVCMIDRYVVGGFYRVHAGRDKDENLNAPGMHFVPLPFAASCHVPDSSALPENASNRFYAYGVVARLALLAASIELERTDPDQSLYG
ncbi:MAG: glutamate--cysteine ligase [Burkholderiaceae bacterium]|nr:glutamate--cysteine ligase [Burkholderiaceae bacterium]